jgi:hypothetical protein
METRTGPRGRIASLTTVACTLLLLVAPIANASAPPAAGFGTAHSVSTYAGLTCYFQSPIAIAIDVGSGTVRVVWALVTQDSGHVSDPGCPTEGDQVGGQGFSTHPGESAACTSGSNGAVSCNYAAHGITLAWTLGAIPPGSTQSSFHIVFNDLSDGSHSDMSGTLTRL